MYTTVLVLMVIVAILLILIILIQNPKGGGISSEFGGAGSQMFGVQRTGDILEKLTWGFFAFIIVGALTAGVFMNKATTEDNGLNVEKAISRPASAPAATPSAVPATAPATGTTPQPVAPQPSK